MCKGELGPIRFLIVKRSSCSSSSSSDMWGLGCLIWESFNGPLKSRNNLKELENVSILKILKKLKINYLIIFIRFQRR